jgi:hypothetical protein
MKKYIDGFGKVWDRNYIPQEIKDVTRNNKNVKKEGIEYPNYRFRYGDRLFPTTKVDSNKVTKRVIYGDSYFGKPERNMYGVRAYNGNEIIGCIAKLESGWLARKGRYWKEYIDKYPLMKKKSKTEYDRICKLYEEYRNYLEGRPSLYRVKLTSNQDTLRRYYLSYLQNYSDIPKTILMELILECFNEKFGIKPVKDVIEIKDNKVIKEVVKL